MPELHVENGPSKGPHAFPDDQAVVIGSGPDCSLQVEGQGIQDRHLVIKALKNGGFGAKKLDGTFRLNGRVAEAARLKEGDTLEVGDCRLTFGRRQPATATPPKAPAPPPQTTPAKPPAKTSARTSAKTRSKAQVEKHTVGGFRIFDLLGKGGMGTVYRAEQVSLHREVALKVLKKELTKDPVFVAGFVAEARAAARLSHPKVVQVFDVGHDGDTYYLSMEIMHAGSLEQRIRSGPIPVDEAVQMVVDAAEGLAYAESLRIVHCDIKPDNLMLDQHGTVKIADLGLAMTDEDNLSKVVGTPHFMSPEQLQRKPLDHRSDLYSLGCTFYRLLTGGTAFQGGSVKDIVRAQLKEDPEPPSKINAEVPAAVSDIVLKLMHKEPGDRYQSANELLEDLHAVQSPPTRKGLIVAVIAVLVIAAFSAIGYAVFKDPERVIIKENGVDPKIAMQLRESNAERAYLKVLIDRSLSPAEVVKRLRAVAAQFEDTKASAAALRIANGMEAEEKKKVAEIAARKQAVDAALDKIRKTVNPLLASQDFRAASAALKDPISDPTIRDVPEVKQALAGLRSQLSRQAKRRLEQLKGATTTSIKDNDPDAVLASLPPLEAILDPTTGWPRDLVVRRDLERFIKDAREEEKELRTSLAANAERQAWVDLQKGVAGEEGILARVRNFDLAGAERQATELAKKLAGREAASSVDGLLGVVRAAHRYFQEFQKNDGGKTRLTGLAGDRLFEVFRMETAGGRLRAERVAFLTLQLIVEQTRAAQVYLKQLDLKNDDTGTGTQAYSYNSLHVRALRATLQKPQTDWQKYLDVQLKALNLMVNGFRALSDKRNQAAANHTTRLLERYRRSLVVLVMS